MSATAAPPGKRPPCQAAKATGRPGTKRLRLGAFARDARDAARELGPIDVCRPIIDEMLELMARQISEVDHLDQGRGLRRQLSLGRPQRPRALPGRRHQARRPRRQLRSS